MNATEPVFMVKAASVLGTSHWKPVEFVKYKWNWELFSQEFGLWGGWVISREAGAGIFRRITFLWQDVDFRSIQDFWNFLFWDLFTHYILNMLGRFLLVTLIRLLLRASISTKLRCCHSILSPAPWDRNYNCSYFTDGSPKAERG